MQVNNEHKKQEAQQGESKFPDHQGRFDDAFSLDTVKYWPTRSKYHVKTMNTASHIGKSNFTVRVTSMERTRILSASGSMIFPSSLS